jgi:hypothetical protein
MTDAYPWASGQFGEVWRGLVKGHAIAIKVLRVFANSNMDELLKVRGPPLCLPC